MKHYPTKVVSSPLAGILMLLFSGIGVTANATPPPLQVVDYVAIERYLGTWYEIASFPQRFQRGCTATSAEYQLRDQGDIRVINRCIDQDSGKIRQAKGRAWVTDATTNAKLRVRFFWPFSGKYWIIELDEDYQFAVVGHPKRNYLWILSRTPEMNEAQYQDILQTLEKKHFYDVSRLQRTAH